MSALLGKVVTDYLGGTMILSSENSVADNGMQVQSTVHLRIENIGNVEKPFFVKVSVAHDPMFHGYFATEAEAKASRKRMHAAYLEAHSKAA